MKVELIIKNILCLLRLRILYPTHTHAKKEVERATNAEIWINPSYYTSYEALEKANQHYTKCDAFKNPIFILQYPPYPQITDHNYGY